jgi:hypothetical protein
MTVEMRFMTGLLGWSYPEALLTSRSDLWLNPKGFLPDADASVQHRCGRVTHGQIFGKYAFCAFRGALDLSPMRVRPDQPELALF